MSSASPSPDSDDSAAQAALQPSEAHLRLIFDSAAIGYALVDLRGRPISANHALQRMLGYSEAELQARTFAELTFHEDVAVDCALFEELLAGTRQSYQIEKRYVRKDGELVWGRLTASMVRGSTPQAAHCVGTVEDITARKRAEEDHTRLEAIVNSSSDAIIGKALDGTITSWNPAAERLYGYTAAEVLGRSICLLAPPDLTELRQRDAALQHYRLLVEHTQDMVLFVGDQGRILECNAAAAAAHGFARAELLQLSIADLVAPVSRSQVAARLMEATTHGLVFESIHLRNDGTTFPVEVSSVGADMGNQRVVLCLIRDITERQRAEADLRRQALHDDLTGLPNRRQLQFWLERAMAQGESDNSPLALLLLDLDRFKEVNDTLGHRVGDVLLQQIGQRLQAAVPTLDMVARLGGDEFALLLPGVDAAGAGQLASLIAGLLEAPFVVEGQRIGVDASIGIAVAPEHGQSADALLRCADVAMYQAKHLGTGVALYSAADDEYRSHRLALLSELRNAIDNDELLLHFQPKVDLRDGKLVGVEALVRWQHPVRGFMAPSEFIPRAERTGLIYPLTRWVLQAALQQQQAWRGIGLDIPVAVNLSRRTLHDPLLPEMLAELLSRWAAPTAGLVLEITESSLMSDPVRATENLAQLQALGVQMSIDDFGTGYSSLASLQNLSVDELKIDQSFVKAMATDASARAIVRAIIDLADALKLRVVAEGVEDRATWDVLAGLGCDVAQGYLVSPPLAVAELEAWVAQVAPAWREIATRPTAADPLQERIRGRGARLTAEEEFIARKRAEAALHASEERNRLALQAAGIGTWDWDAVHDVLTWSAEMESLSGLAPGTFDGTFAGFQRSIHPDDWPAFEAEIHEADTQRRELNITCRTVSVDGSVHWIENKGRGLYADEILVRMTGTSMDVTERKLAEEALKASEERFRRQYKGGPLPTYSWLKVDDDFVMQDYNDAAEAIAEGDVNTWVGALASERYVEQPEILADLHECVRQQRTLRRELRFRYPVSGRERELALSYVFVPPHAVMLHSEDITERKQAEQHREAMAQSEKLRALGQMATGIAHDLNQSLMLVASYSGLARQALLEDPPNVRELEDLLTTTTRAALDGGVTVKRLLQFTRAEPDHDMQPVELSKVVRDAAQLTAPRWRDASQAEGRPISLDVEVDGHPSIRGSSGQLRELMTNLIFNAVDALPAGGTIRLRVLLEQEQGVIEVADSGIGMSAEIQRRVFEPFFTTKGERGTGLGLAMVFGIVEQHGGRIVVRSAPGEGTCFRITLPLVEASADAESATPDAVLPAPRLTLRVLLVDDEPMMTKAVIRMLKPSGHVVSVAGSGEEALEQLAERPFDVVVSDMGMGAGINGWELAHAVKHRWPAVRFLLATGWGAAIDPGEARAKGVEAVLAKPYQLQDLLLALAGSDRAA